MKIDFYKSPNNMTWCFENGYSVSICYGNGAYGTSEFNSEKNILSVYSADVMVNKYGKTVTQQFFPDSKINNGWTSINNILALLTKIKTM